MEIRRDVFQAIADPTRRAIIGMLAKDTLNLNAIADNFDVSRPAISQHIKILTECGLIIIKKQGRERYCEVKLKELDEVSDWIDKYRRMWEDRFDRLENLLSEIQAKKKKTKNKNKL